MATAEVGFYARVDIAEWIGVWIERLALAHGDAAITEDYVSGAALAELFRDDDPEPPAPAAPRLVRCDGCCGTGRMWFGTGLEVEQAGQVVEGRPVLADRVAVLPGGAVAAVGDAVGDRHPVGGRDAGAAGGDPLAGAGDLEDADALFQRPPQRRLPPRRGRPPLDPPNHRRRR